MSYELIFWQQRPGADLDPAAVYTALTDETAVDGLNELPVEPLLENLSAAFPGAVRELNGSDEWLVWERPDGSGALEVTWSSQHLRADCRGLNRDEMNRIIDAGIDGKCPLYDPQIVERFPFGGF